MIRRQMQKRADDIAEFTELGDYLQMSLRTYSAGMRVIWIDEGRIRMSGSVREVLAAYKGHEPHVVPSH